MSTPADLMGLGMAAGLANRIGNNPITVTTAGTSAGAATLMTGSRMFTLSTAGSQTGGILDSGFSIGAIVYVDCATATTGIVYPQTGGTINGGSSLSLAQNKSAILWKFSSTAWKSVLTA